MKDPKSIEGFLTENEGECLRKYATNKICLEIGSYKGKSSAYIASTAKLLVCLDMFDSEWNGSGWELNDKIYDEFKTNTKGYNNIIPVITSSPKSSFMKEDFFDFIFIDGNHSYESVLGDIILSKSRVKKGGVLLLHDYSENYQGVMNAVDETFGKPSIIVDSLVVIEIN